MMSRFIMLIQLSPATAGSPRSIAEQGQRISAQLRRNVPQATLLQRHVVKNHCDLVDLIEAPSFDVIERAANTVELMGHRVTDLMTATPWDQFNAASAAVGPAEAISAPDPVPEASEESFPASDPSVWTGPIATKAPVSRADQTPPA